MQAGQLLIQEFDGDPVASCVSVCPDNYQITIAELDRINPVPTTRGLLAWTKLWITIRIAHEITNARYRHFQDQLSSALKTIKLPIPFHLHL